MVDIRKLVILLISLSIFLLSGCGERNERETAENLLEFSLPEEIEIYSESSFIPLVEGGQSFYKIGILQEDKDFTDQITAWAPLPWDEDMDKIINGYQTTESHPVYGEVVTGGVGPRVLSLYDIPSDIENGYYKAMDYDTGTPPYADAETAILDGSSEEFCITAYDSDSNTLYIYYCLN